MPEVPRDPRQLARDILSGKVRIEDLARERQMRAGGGGLAPRAPVKIPLPRPAQAPLRPPVPPPVFPRQIPRQAPMPPRAIPQRQPQRPLAVPPVQRVTPRGPQFAVSAAPPPRPAAQAYAPVPEPKPVVRPARRTARLNELVGSKTALRQGILLAEVLGKPVSMRE